MSVKVLFLFFLIHCLNPEGRFSFWLHLRLYREVRGHGQLQNNIPVFQLKDGLMFAGAKRAGFFSTAEWGMRVQPRRINAALDECKFNTVQMD